MDQSGKRAADRMRHTAVRVGRDGGTRRARALRCSMAGALTAAALGASWLPATTAGALPANCSQNVQTVTCTYGSGTNTFIVPKGVATLHVAAVGGRGGASPSTYEGFYPGAPGGFGARVTGDVSVTPGESLFVVVGGNGGLATGGSNGGGGGVPDLSGGGGGASDVRTSQSDFGSRLIVAAGGGGGGGNGAFYGVGGTGGDASFAGGDGVDYGGLCGGDPCYARGGEGGGAGTGSAGGSGGAGGHFADDPFLGYSGQDGDLGLGGDAHVGEGQGMQGGGGGGLYGGGSGGSGGYFFIGEDDTQGGSGGGGGGSSLVPSGGTSAVDSTGTPVVVISYTAPILVSPSSIDFGSQAVGSSSAPKTVTLSDTGSDAIAVGAVDIIGTNAADFSVSSDNCSGTSVAAGSQCTVQVRFAPAATGSRSATLRFTDDATGSPHSVSMSGVGTTLADVGVTISGPSSAPTSSQNSYAITVSNAGPSTALNVVLTTQVPKGTKYVGTTTTHGSCTGPKVGSTSGTITCSLGTLVSGVQAVTTTTLKITLTGKGGSINNVAQAYSTGDGATPDPSLGNNVASFGTTVGKR